VKPQTEQKPEEKNGKAQETRPQEKQQAETQAHGKPAGKSARIPDDKFREHFGRQHTVVINRPVVVEGQPRFQSNGYWFGRVDARAADWAYSDECYIDYIDGEYFLFDVLHPGIRIALFVTS